MKKLFCFLMFFLTGDMIIAFAQCSESSQFSHLTLENGLADNNIACIQQDHYGFVWIGTSYGLSRYDAYTLKNYHWSANDSSSIESNYITSIVKDTVEGNLWVATHGGLCYYNQKTDVFIRHTLFAPDKMQSIYVNSMYFSNKYGLILCCQQGLLLYNTKNPQWIRRSPDQKEGLCSNEVLAAFEDSYHHLWIGTRNGLNRIDPETMDIEHISLKIDDKLPLYVYEIHEDSNNNLLLCTRYHGLIRLLGGNTQSIEVFGENIGLRGNWIEEVVEAAPNQYWVSVRDGGLTLLDTENKSVCTYLPDKYDPYNVANINSKATTKLFKDNQGNIWVGTYNNGVNLLDFNKKPFRHYKVVSKPGALINNNIRCLFQDSEGRIWIGTKEGGGLSEFIPHENRFEHYLNDPSKPYTLNDDYVFSIEEFNRDILLIGTFKGGLNIFDKRTKQFSTVLNVQENLQSDLLNAIYTIHKDSKDRIWIGTLKNLCLFDMLNKRFTLVNDVFEVNDVLEDSFGSLWFISAKSGLIKLNEETGKFENVTIELENGISVNNLPVNHFFEDSKKNLWLATSEHGVICYSLETGKTSIYSQKQGLKNNQTLAVTEDQQGNIWTSTGMGLSRIDTRKIVIDNYQYFDGLPKNNYTKQVGLKLKNGELIFGGNQGFVIFNPSSIVKNQFVPPVFISELKISNQTIDFKTDQSILSQPVYLTKNIILKHNQSDITLEFTALNYSTPEKNQYAYKLEGFDSDWILSGTERRAIYTNLDPGKYVFRLKASNNDGIWNEKGTQLKIRILPPFWETWVAYVIYAMAILVIINAFYWYLKMKENYKNNLMKERFQRKKEEELHLSKMKFFTNISHEFRTPLTLIIGPVRELMSRAEALPFSSEIQMIYKNAQLMLQQVNQLMDFRKIETNNMTMNVSNSDIVKVIHQSIESFGLLASQKQIEIIFEHQQKTLIASIDFEKLISVLSNLISNAIKYSRKKSTIKLKLSTTLSQPKPNNENWFSIINTELGTNSQFFQFTIIDEGLGIKPEDLSKIFERYYRASKFVTLLIPGTGIGLAVVKSYVEAHAGNIIIESYEEKGTSITVQLPIAFVGSDYIQGQMQSDIDFSTPLKGNEQIETITKIGNNPVNTILVVDDNEDMISFLHKSLSPNYKVLSAMSADDALHQLEKTTPDLIISDIMMPGTNGYELCKLLKENQQTCHIPVILLTAKDSIESKISGMQIGADAYISKPFELTFLKVQIDNLIEQRRLLREIFSKKIDVSPSEIATISLDEKFVCKLLASIEQNISNPELNIEVLCGEIGMSRSNLHLKVKATTGYSTGELIKIMRLKRAAQLLKSGGYYINDVVHEVGFTSPSYFSQCFKAHFNVSPQQYIKNIQNYEN